MLNKKNTLVAAAFLCLAPSLAYADGGFYGLAGIGRHTTEIKTANAAAAAMSADMSASQRAYSFGGGYRINGNFAVESNYYNMGSSVRHDALGAVGARAATVSALAMLPIGERAELFVRAGVGRMNISVQPDGVGETRRNVSVRQFGLGVNLLVGQRSFVRGEWNAWGGGGNTNGNVANNPNVRAYNVNHSQFTLSYGLRF